LSFVNATRFRTSLLAAVQKSGLYDPCESYCCGVIGISLYAAEAAPLGEWLFVDIFRLTQYRWMLESMLGVVGGFFPFFSAKNSPWLLGLTGHWCVVIWGG